MRWCIQSEHREEKLQCFWFRLPSLCQSGQTGLRADPSSKSWSPKPGQTLAWTHWFWVLVWSRSVGLVWASCSYLHISTLSTSRIKSRYRRRDGSAAGRWRPSCLDSLSFWAEQQVSAGLQRKPDVHAAVTVVKILLDRVKLDKNLWVCWIHCMFWLNQWGKNGAGCGRNESDPLEWQDNNPPPPP